MASNIFRTKNIYSEIATAIKNQNEETPIIDKYYTEVRLKAKPSIEAANITDENHLRRILINELSPILKDQTTNFIERLATANDLTAFYKFSKIFIAGTKDIRDIDASFMFKLWEKFKSKMIIEQFDYPHGSKKDGNPRGKPGPKKKESLIDDIEEEEKVEEKVEEKSPGPGPKKKVKNKKAPQEESLIHELKNSPGFRSKQEAQIKGNGIVGMTYIARR